MGTSSLAKLAAAPAKVAATTTQYNAAVDALQGHLVMRDSNGAVEDGVSDIGRPSSGRPRKLHVSEGIVIGGQTLNTEPYLLARTGITSGRSKACGYPQFLEPGDDTGAGASHIVRILATDTDLEMTIDGQAYTLETDLESAALDLAPSSNNTCLVAQALYADQQNTRTLGEFGYWIDVDGIGSEISALTGTTQCFKIYNGSATEVFLAKVEVDETGTSTNKITPILRGIAETDRIVFADNDTITLLKAHYIFLDNDLATISTTTTYPTWAASAPAAPAVGDYWWDVANQTWKKYSGVEWETLGRIYLGYAIADSAGINWVEHEDYNLNWDSLYSIKEITSGIVTAGYAEIKGPLNISAAGKTVKISDDIQIAISTETDWSWRYLYIDNAGAVTVSTVCPRANAIKGGLYHPYLYKRCFGVVAVVSSGQVKSIQLTTGVIQFDPATIPVFVLTSGTAADYVLAMTDYICPLANEASVAFTMSNETGETAYFHFRRPSRPSITNLISSIALSVAGIIEISGQVKFSEFDSGVFSYKKQHINSIGTQIINESIKF